MEINKLITEKEKELKKTMVSVTKRYVGLGAGMFLLMLATAAVLKFYRIIK